MIKRDIVLYALSTAINKGSILLFFPLITNIYTLEEFGVWSLVIVVSYLLLPIVSLNGSVSILREGSENTSVGYRLLVVYLLITLFIGGFSASIFYLAEFKNWFFYALIIAIADASLFLSMTFIRAQQKPVKYFLINVVKVASIFLMLLFVKRHYIELDQLFVYQALLTAMVSLVVFLDTLWQKKGTLFFEKINVIPFLAFSIAFIPHGISQWVMSSSDRFIIEQFLGATSLGLYSLAYNISLVLMLANSGISLALPTFMIKYYSIWTKEGWDNKFISYYTIAAVFLYCFILIAYVVDFNYTRFLGHYDKDIIFLISIIYLSLFMLGIYYFYVNHLFYYKRAGVISKSTFFAAVINVVLTLILIFPFGVIGAGIATLLSYSYYLLIIRKEAISANPEISIKLLRPFLLMITAILLVGSAFYVVGGIVFEKA